MKIRSPNNLNFIATYLYLHPGARYTEILKALYCWKNKPYRKGCGTIYLSSNMYANYRNRLWFKTGPSCSKTGYLLTLEGMARVIPEMNMEAQHG